MKKPATLQTHQLGTFARFLEEHPGFSPLLCGEEALVYAFQVGTSALDVPDMEKLIGAQPHFDAREIEALLASLSPSSRGR